MTQNSWYLAIGAAAFLLTIPLVLLSERFGRATGLVDHPRRGELQEYILPRTGGYGVLVGFWAAIGLSFLIAPVDLERLPADNWRLIGLFVGSMAIIPLALADDHWRLGPAPQI